MSDEDSLIEILAKEADGERLTRAERSALNKAKWAQSKANAVVVKPERKPVGTYTGNRQRMTEFKELLLSPVTGSNIIHKVINIAQDDAHPGQMAALKICMDRLLPTSLFEEKKDGSRVAVTISISGIGDAPVVIDNDSGEIQ